MKLRSSRRTPPPAKTPKASWSWPRGWTRSANSGRLIIRWKILCTYLFLGCAVLWLSFSTALYHFIKHKSGYDEVRFAHIVGLPFTLEAYRRSKGEFWLEQGLVFAREGEWRMAFSRLRQGLTFVPDNQEARMTLGRLYLMSGRPDLARTTLLEGVDQHGDQAEYLRSVITFLFSQQSDETVIEISQTLLARPDLPTGLRRTLAIAQLYAQFNRDQFKAAQATAEREGLVSTPEARFIAARIAWESGTRETALVMLRDLHRRVPRDLEVYRTLSLYLREMDRLDEARRLALSQQWAWPESPDAYIDYIALSALDDNTARQIEAEAAFLTQFSQNPEALLKLGTWAAQVGNHALAWRLVPLFKPGSTEISSATLLALEAQLRARDYANARTRIAQARSDTRLPWRFHQKLILQGMEAVAQLGLGQNPEALQNFNQVIASTQVPAANLSSLAWHVEMLGDTDMATRLLQRATELDPLHQNSLVALLRLQLQEHRLDENLSHVERLPTMRKPPEDLLRNIVKNLESDRYLFVAERKAAIAALQARLANAPTAPRVTL